MKKKALLLPHFHFCIITDKDPAGTDTLFPDSDTDVPPGLSLYPTITGSMDEPRSEAVLDQLELTGVPTQPGVYEFTVRYTEDPYYAETYTVTVQ